MKSELLIGLLCLTSILAQAQDPATDAAALAKVRFDEGVKAYNNGAYEKAIGLFSEVLELEPGHLNAYLQRGFCHSLQREYAQAVEDFTAVIRQKPDHLWAFTSRGSAYGKWGKQELAIADFNRVLELDPKNQEAYNNRGWAKKALGDHKGACDDWHASRKLGNSEAKIILLNNRCK